MKKDLVDVLGIQFMNIKEQFFVALLFGIRRPIVGFKYLIEKMHNKLTRWKSSLLSHTRREVLIKASLTAILNFQMALASSRRLRVVKWRIS